MERNINIKETCEILRLLMLCQKNDVSESGRYCQIIITLDVYFWSIITLAFLRKMYLKATVMDHKYA